MKKLIVALAVLALVSLPAFAQKANLVTDTQHGAISTGNNKCEGCHVPHNGASGRILLWDQSLPLSQTYERYQSASLDNATADIVSAASVAAYTIGADENQSLLCLSCHDGTISTVTLQTATYGTIGDPVTGTAIDVGNDLSNDHPVNMTLDPLNDAGLDTVANVEAAGLQVYGLTNTVQCGSCHNPHDNTTSNDGATGPGNGKYLRLTTDSSTLCLTCHL